MPVQNVVERQKYVVHGSLTIVSIVVAWLQVSVPYRGDKMPAQPLNVPPAAGAAPAKSQAVKV